MKSEPDRLDFLIVVLPILLFGLLGFQAYEYIQMDRQRAGALPVSSEESPAAADEQEPESPESESGDAATDLPTAPTPDAQPGDVGAGDTEAQSADTVTADPGATDSPAESPAPAAGEPAADADQALDEGEPAAADTDQAPATGEPAAAEADQPAAEALPLIAARTEALVPEQPDAPQEIVLTEVLLEPQTNPAKVGEVFAVDVIIRDASEAFGTVFHLRYDTRLLQLNEDPRSELGPFFEDPEGGTRFNAAPLANGKLVVSIMLAHASAGRSGDGRLATFYFQALAPGETRLDLIQSALRDRLNRPLAAVFSNATLLIVE